MADHSGTRVLVVDDSSTMRRILRQTLSRCGYPQVEEAGDGAEALVKCRDNQFDCILTDWNMPEVDGLEFVQKIRKNPTYAKVPIMMVTTEGGKQDVIEALTKGVDAYIIKPFTPDILGGKMDELLS